jgi:signal transduction histidine kinase
LLTSLRTKVAIVFLLVALAPLGAGSVLAIRACNRLIVGLVSSQLDNLAAEKQELVERWMSERRADLELAADSAQLRGLQASQIGPFLRLLQEKYKVYRQFTVAAADGRIVYATDGASGSVADQAWHRKAITGEDYLSDVRLAPDGQEAVFHLATTVRGAQGRPLGTLCAEVSTRSIVARVLRVSLGKTGECYLVDRTGMFLAHQHPRRILKETIAQSGSFAHIFQSSQLGTIYTDYRGIAVLGASRAVQGTPWFVVVEQDRDEAFESADRLARAMWIGLFVTACVAIALSWAVAWYVVGPIRRLRDAAVILAHGEYEHAAVDAQTTRADEIGALAAAFREMAGDLGRLHAGLKQRLGLTEEQLRLSDAKLQETIAAAARSEHLAALGGLAAGMAHEIRTPLASLKLFLQAVAEELPAPEQTEDLQIALRQVRRIETTINHFLDFARPSVPQRTEVDFFRLVDDAIAVVRPRANHQRVQVDAVVAAGLPEVQGDVRQLTESLVNLLANAVDAMPSGGRLTISVTADVGCGVRIEVGDTGPGIADEDLPRLFQPFFTTKPSGSGLGLAIVRNTIERHGGQVTVSSPPGQGTRFTIHLPMPEPPAASA